MIIGVGQEQGIIDGRDEMEPWKGKSRPLVVGCGHSFTSEPQPEAKLRHRTVPHLSTGIQYL